MWVDDNPQNNLAIRRNLTRYGIRVDVCVSNAKAIEAIRHPDHDIVISDVFRSDEHAEYAVVDGKTVKQSGLDLARHRPRRSASAMRSLGATPRCARTRMLRTTRS
jgi:CheY-like chemotaxis protein